MRGELDLPKDYSRRVHYADDESWLYCGPVVTSSQGWKFYVSATILNIELVLDQVLPCLLHHNCSFKYVRNSKVLRKLNSGLSGYSQIGKTIVIYLQPSSTETIVELVQTLQPFVGQCPAVPLARQVSAKIPLYYRFGGYKGDTLFLNDEIAVDDRTANQQRRLPVDEDPFAGMFTLAPARSELDQFLERFPVLKALSQSGKSGVFLACNTRSSGLSEVVVKVGYKNGAVQPDGRDGYWFVKRDLQTYQQMSAEGWSDVAPSLIDAHADDDDIAFVTERVRGPDLHLLKQASALGVRNLEDAWSLIQQFHERGLILSDPKLSNFVMDLETQSVKAIDFEACCNGWELVQGAQPIRTFWFDLQSTPQNLDRIHFLVSVLFEKRSVGTISDQKIVLSEFVAKKKCQSIVDEWALAKLKAEL